MPFTNEQYGIIGKKVWHEGVESALKYAAEVSENKIDDVIVPVVNKIMDEVAPVPEVK